MMSEQFVIIQGDNKYFLSITLIDEFLYFRKQRTYFPHVKEFHIPDDNKESFEPIFHFINSGTISCIIYESCILAYFLEYHNYINKFLEHIRINPDIDKIKCFPLQELIDKFYLNISLHDIPTNIEQIHSYTNGCIIT